MIGRLYKLFIPRRLRELMYPLLSSLYMPVHFYSSPAVTERGGPSLVVACIGINENRNRLWGKRLLGDDSVCSRVERIWLWSLKSLYHGRKPACDLLVVETNRLLELLLGRRKGYKLPMWVQFCLDTSLPLTTLKKRSSKLRQELPRLTRKYSLSFEIADDEHSLSQFFDTMYLPYITGRHGETAFLSPLAELQRVFENAELLLIKKNAERIAGCLLEKQGEMVLLRYIGVKDNDPRHFRDGVVGALYYFAIVRAQERGYSVFNMGGTSPFLADGVARFKLSLKPHVDRICYLGEYPVRLWLGRRSDRLLEFLNENPFLFLRPDGQFDELLLIDNSASGYEQRLLQLLKETRCYGVKTLHLALKDASPAGRQELAALEELLPENVTLEILSWDSVLPDAKIS